MKNNPYQHKIITIPNLLSFFRLCLIPLLIYLYCIQKNDQLTTIVLILSGISDIADGFIARHFHMISDLGKILDPVADKCTQAAVLLCLTTRFPFILLPLVLMIFKECYMGISGYMIIKKTGEVYGALWHGKVATFLLYTTMILHIFWNDIPSHFSCVLIYSCTVMILISLILYIIRNTQILKNK